MSRNSIVIASALVLLLVAAFAFNSGIIPGQLPGSETNSIIVREGTFKGHRRHEAAGLVVVTESENSITIEIKDNFTFNGAPDPYISLGDGSSHIKDTAFAPLKKNKGAQRFEIPKNLTDIDFDSIVIWCKKYDIKLGSARLNES